MSAPSPPVASVRLSSSNISAREMWGAPSSSVSLSTGIFEASKIPKIQHQLFQSGWNGVWVEGHWKFWRDCGYRMYIIQNCASTLFRSMLTFRHHVHRCLWPVCRQIYTWASVLKYSVSKSPQIYSRIRLQSWALHKQEQISARGSEITQCRDNIFSLTSEDVNILPQTLILLQVLQEVLVLSKDKNNLKSNVIWNLYEIFYGFLHWQMIENIWGEISEYWQNDLTRTAMQAWEKKKILSSAIIIILPLIIRVHALTVFCHFL